MPKYSDLESLKDSIQKTGAEPEITEKKSEVLNDTALPEEIKTSTAATDLLSETGEIMSDIMEDLSRGGSLKDEEESSDINDIIKDKEPTSDLDNMITGKEPPPEPSMTEEMSGGGIEDLGFQPSPEGIKDQSHEMDLSSFMAEEEPRSGSEEVDMALEDLLTPSGETPQSEEAPLPGIVDLGETLPEEPLPEQDTSKIEAESALEELEDIQSIEEELAEGGYETRSPAPIGPSVAASEGEEENEVDNILEELGKEAESYTDLQALDSLLGDEESSKSPAAKEEDMLSGIPEVDGLSSDDLEVRAPEEDADMTTEEHAGGQFMDHLDEFAVLDKGAPETPPGKETASASLEDIGVLDLEGLESFTPEPIDEPPPPPPDKTASVKKTAGGKPIIAAPEELSEEELRSDKDIDLKLSDDDRKQIVLSLTSLQKEAEIKISKAIVSGKYSNLQLKPLIDALLNKEGPQAIIRYYEKITGDRSLSRLEAAKYTGEKFEEMQKTFAYVFQKNVLPILSMIASALVVVASIVFIFVRMVFPTWQATVYYEKGKDKIREKIFWEVESNFKRAFDIQPRFNEAAEYARLYRNYKRYLEAEKKYELAVSMKPGRIGIALEYADFFREIGDYERAEKKHRSLLVDNEKNTDILLGLADTYYDWSNVEAGKLENAKETYLDVLDIDKNNKKAVYGNLRIYIKEKDNKQIMKYYAYIEKNFGKKTDPLVYTELAEYLINTGVLVDARDVLSKASASMNRNVILPELDYEYARYKNLLNVFGEEKTHLMNALGQFERLKRARPDLYENKKYQTLLAKVYNDLGENFDRSSRANIEAEEYYLKAVRSDPYYGKPYYNLANFALYYKPGGYKEAKLNYLEALQKGFSNDTLEYNLGWLYYKDKEYYNSFRRLNGLLEKYPDNSNLKFMTATVFYKLGNYDIAEGELLELVDHFEDIKLKNGTLDPEIKEHRDILEMLKKITNNLGAAYQKKYERTRRSSYIISATKFYSDSVNIFELLSTTKPLEAFTWEGGMSKPSESATESEAGYGTDRLDTFRKENAHINLRMVLYPDAGLGEPIIYEDFSLDFMTYF